MDVDALTFDCKQVIIHVSSSCMSVIFILLLNCTFTLYIYGIMIMLLSIFYFFEVLSFITQSSFTSRQHLKLYRGSLHRSSVELFGVVGLQYHLEQMFLFGGKGKEPPQGLGSSV